VIGPGPAPLSEGPPGALGPAGPRGSWGPVKVLAGVGVLLAITIFAAVTAGLFDPDLESLGAKLYLQAVLAASMIGVAFIAAGETRPVGPDALGLGRSLRSPFVPALIAIVAYVIAANVVYQLFQPEQEDVTRELGAGQSILGDLASFTLIVIAAPLAEEIFFRGFMFGGIRFRVSFPVAALVSAGVWGLFHFTGSDSWPVVLQLTLFGVILCWLYERTGSIRAPIVLHVANNLIAYIAATS
jgi:uncharacterized protein